MENSGEMSELICITATAKHYPHQQWSRDHAMVEHDSPSLTEEKDIALPYCIGKFTITMRVRQSGHADHPVRKL